MTAPDREQAASPQWLLCTEHLRVIHPDYSECPFCKGDRNLVVVVPAALILAEREAAVRECMSAVDDVSLTEKYGSRVYKCLLGLKQRMRDLLRPPPPAPPAPPPPKYPPDTEYE